MLFTYVYGVCVRVCVLRHNTTLERSSFLIITVNSNIQIYVSVLHMYNHSVQLYLQHVIQKEKQTLKGFYTKAK